MTGLCRPGPRGRASRSAAPERVPGFRFAQSRPLTASFRGKIGTYREDGEAVG